MSFPGFDEPGWPDDAVEVGRVVDAWGIKGGFKVLPFSSEPQALFSSRRWFLKPPTESRGVAPPPLLKITSAREHGDVVVATAQEIPDRTAAEALKGSRVFISRASFPTAEEGEYYWVDLIGLSVINREGQALGTVGELFDTGAHSVMRVVDGDTERLIPFVCAYVDAVSLAERTIRVDWGLEY